MAILEARGITKRFGGLVAVDSVNFSVAEAAIASIIGPNGAGKTTFFNIMTGIYKPDEGTFLFKGAEIQGKRPDQITSAGISRTFQNIRLFSNMTVIENLLVGAHTQISRSTMVGAILRTKRFRQIEMDAVARARELLDFVGLRGAGDELAKNLPYGAQRRVEIARALAANPALILLDEPTAGMNPSESESAMILFRRLRDELGITVLLIEHDMRVVMGISEYITVLHYGQKITEGTPVEVRKDQKVIEAYLGRQSHDVLGQAHGPRQVPVSGSVA